MAKRKRKQTKYHRTSLLRHPDQQAMRKCLGWCGKEFLSDSRSHRFCSQCHIIKQANTSGATKDGIGSFIQGRTGNTTF